MTFGSRPALVGAVFPNRATAKEAAADLRSSGFTDEQLATAEWLDNQYAIASHAGRNIGQSLFWGGVIGALLGGVAGAVLASLLWQTVDTVVALLVGGVAGAVTIGFLGAYFGLNRYRPQLWDQRDWSHLEIEEGEVLIVLAAEERPEVVGEILERHGGRRVEPVHPDQEK